MHIAAEEVQAWLDTTKVVVGPQLDAELEVSIATEVLSRVALSYDTSTWTSIANTPRLVRRVIALKYASWFYQRAYSEDNDSMNQYALLLNAQAEQLIDGIVRGVNDLPEVAGSGGTLGAGQPAANISTPVFTMGQVF